MEPGFIDQLAALYHKGGFVMPPLLIGAMLLWYALGYRLLALRRGRRLSVRQLLRAQQRGEPGRLRGVIDGAVAAGVELARRGPRNLRSRLDVAFFDFERRIARFSTLVKAIVVVAPLLGLLGTVSGMIETFDSLGDMSLFTQSGGVAGGISEALFSTQLGLAVAVPGLLAGRILARRQALLAIELDEVKNAVCAGAREVA